MMKKSSMLYSSNEKRFFNKEDKNSHIKQQFFKNLIAMILIMLICTIVSMFFNHIKMSESNIVMLYLLGVLIFSFLAEGYIYSFFASICAVLLYNFFFTEPYYTLKVDNPNYFFTFFVMFIVGFITSMLTIRVKLERQLVEDREVYISSLYYIERKLLNVKSGENLAEVSAEEISKLFNANILVKFFDTSGKLLYKNVMVNEVFNGHIDCTACDETYHSGSPCGRGTTLFPNAKAYYTAIMNEKGVLGVIGVSLQDSFTLTNAQRAFIDVIAPQIAVVLERERVYEKQKQTQIEIQAEHLRADMLRSISHDLRTPLANIMGSASTSLDNYGKITDKVKKSFLQSIYEDADWLNELVENILQTTRFEEGKAQLNMGQEAAEEIIIEAVTHVKKHAKGHKIFVEIPNEIILVQVDGVLIRQVVINILNNAINYSPEGSDITVSLYLEENHAIFQVKDNGPGISQEELPHMFERYYHKNTNKGSNRKGIGLGLALCKSIVEAHNGRISISNNMPHGTIVSFYVLSEMEGI